ncbi:hypothetical protein [Vibrio sp. 1CM23M]|uniref:hypothetical protein n=1 Tax=Vibrio sp. 1CM23M TaxID=2929164 RepID=UPI0020C14C3E|nr:hypothetical protein [Vibrio sp. 1CM23M]MCK8072444.1 hypothetical protein [Vibrio sp. 1CM23M]
MVHEGKRLVFDRNALYNLVMYFIINKNTKKYDPNRADFVGDMFPEEMNDLGTWLKKNGERVSKRVLEKHVRNYTDEAFTLIAEKYILSSDQKRKSIVPVYLDKNNKPVPLSILKEYFHKKCKGEFTHDALYKLLGTSPADKPFESVSYEVASFSKGGIPSMFMYYGSINPTEDAFERLESYLRNKHKGASDKFIAQQMKDELMEATKYFLAELSGDLEISDVRGFFNFHMEQNDGHNQHHGHLHYVVSAFNPVTKKFFNPKRYDLAKQKAHIATEKKYKHWFEQGIAAGLTPEVQALRNNSLSLIVKQLRKSQGITDESTLCSMSEEVYDKSVNRVSEVIEDFASVSGLSFEKYQEAFKKLGITVEAGATRIKNENNKRNHETEQFLVFTDDRTGAVMTNPHLKSKARTVVKRLGNRYMDDRSLAQIYGNKSLVFQYDQIETVLKDTLDNVKSDMDRKLKRSENTIFENDSDNMKELKKDNIKKIKHDAYKQFFDMSLKKGIIVNMTKPNSNGVSNLTYHKISSSFRDSEDFQAQSYKSSNFVLDLQGKTISEIMALDPEIVQFHQDKIMQYLQVGYSKYKCAFLNDDSLRDQDFNDTMQEYFQSKYHEDLMNKNGWEIKYNEDNNAFWLTDKYTGQGLVCFIKDAGEENSYSIITNELNPIDAAKAIVLMETDEVKKLADNEFFTYSSMKHGKTSLSSSPTFEQLYLNVMFSKDKILRDKLSVFVKTAGLEQKAMSKLSYSLENSNKKFDKVKATAIKKDKFDFTDAYCVHLLSIEKTRGSLESSVEMKSFEEMENNIITDINDRVKDNISEQIAYLIDNNVTKITIKSKKIDKFIIENRETISNHIKDESKIDKFLHEQKVEISTKKKKSNKVHSTSK